MFMLAVILVNYSALSSSPAHRQRSVSSRLQFHSYVPGLAELPWLSRERIIDGQVCDIASNRQLVSQLRRSIDVAKALRAHPRAPPTPTVDQRSAVSHMVNAALLQARPGAYPLTPRNRRPVLASSGLHRGQAYCDAHIEPSNSTRSCRVEPIEPLHGFGRHPFAQVGCRLHERGEPPVVAAESSIFNIEHLILTSRCSDKGPIAPVHTGRNLFFDAGCSVYGHGKPLPGRRRMAQPSAAGPSLPLFAAMYAKRCIEFDGLWGWEARPHTPAKWWEAVPLEVRSRMHFYNVPIEQGTASDPLLTIGQVARPEDFVAFKLDIDTFDVEHEVRPPEPACGV
jgi:hypothetical protein